MTRITPHHTTSPKTSPAFSFLSALPYPKTRPEPHARTHRGRGLQQGACGLRHLQARHLHGRLRRRGACVRACVRASFVDCNGWQRWNGLGVCRRWGGYLSGLIDSQPPVMHTYPTPSDPTPTGVHRRRGGEDRGHGGLCSVRRHQLLQQALEQYMGWGCCRGIGRRRQQPQQQAVTLLVT